MEKKRQEKSKTTHSQSPLGSGAYFPLEKKKKSVGGFAALALLIGVLGGAGIWYKQISTGSTPPPVVMETKEELVSTVQALIDDQDNPVVKEKYVKLIKTQEEKDFESVISPCLLDGHDLYWIDEDGIVSKLKYGDDRLKDRPGARDLIESHAAKVIVATKDGLKGYNSDGRLIKPSQP